MLDRIETWLWMALAIAAYAWSEQRRAFRRADRRGEPRPAAPVLSWQLAMPLLAIGVGALVARHSQRFLPKPGGGLDVIVFFGAAFGIGCLAAGAAWLLLTRLGRRGPAVQVALGLAIGAAVLLQFGLPGLLSSPVSGHPRALTALDKAMSEVYHGPNGVVPDMFRVEMDPDVFRLTNLDKSPKAVSVARVLPKPGGGVERCQLGAEEKEGLNFRPVIWPGTTVAYPTRCDARFLAEGELEFRVSLLDGTRVYMSKSAFLP
jgi:hypothetical protein